jgi:uncharacterized membrane protein YbhN (UPF0104 family)
MRVQGKLARLAGYLLVAVVLFLVLRQLFASWPAVHTYPWQLRWPYLLASLVLAQCAYLTLARAWRSILRAIQVRLRLTTAYWIFLISNLGRYLPGKLWQIGAAALFARKLGLSGRDVAASMVVYQLYLIPAGALLVLAGGGFPAPFDTPAVHWTAWIGVALLACVALWPHVVLQAARPLARWAKIEPERWRIELSRRAAVAVQCALGWILLSLAFGLFAMAVTPTAPGRLVTLAQAFIASYLIGYLALIVPGGIGVREGVITILLAPILGPGPAAGLALLSRLWVTVTELIALVPALVLARREQVRIADVGRLSQSEANDAR